MPTKTRLTTEERKQLSQATKAVDAYLRALDASKQRSRRQSREKLQQQLDEINRQMEGSKLSKFEFLHVFNQKIILERALKDDPAAELEERTAAFIEHAKFYGQMKGIGISAWRQVGVPRQVLAQANIT